jgi:hypothetical protein
LPPDAHLRAALRHAPDAQARPDPALRAAIVRAAHDAVRAGAPPAPRATPGAVSALGRLWRRFWQAPTPARPAWAAGLAAAVVASLTLTLWWGEPEPPVREEPPLPAAVPPPAPEAAAPQAQSATATPAQPPTAALGSTPVAPAREAVAPAADAADAGPARKPRAEAPAVRPSTDARPRAALPATVAPAAPAAEAAAPAPAAPPAALAKAAEAAATDNATAEPTALAQRQSWAAQAVETGRPVASVPPTLAQRAATGEPWRTLARLNWQPAEPPSVTADPSPSATWQRLPGGMLWREPDGRQWFAPVAPAERPALDAALQQLQRGDVAPAAPASTAR